MRKWTETHAGKTSANEYRKRVRMGAYVCLSSYSSANTDTAI